MDILDLVPFEGTQMQRVEDFDASKLYIKELRMKDLHKNLCKKPHFHAGLNLHKRNSSEGERAEPSGEQHRSSFATSDAEYETCEEDGVASIQGDPVLRSPSEDTRREELPAAEQPCNRTCERKTCLPGKFRDDYDAVQDLSENYPIFYKRGVLKPTCRDPRTGEKPHSIQAEFFEVPIEAYEEVLSHCNAAAASSRGHRVGLGSVKVADSHPCTPSQQKSPTRPLKQVYHSPSSSQKRHLPTTKHSRVVGDDSEYTGASTDTDPSESPSNPSQTSSMKWKHKSPDATGTKEALSTGKRTRESESNVKAGKGKIGSTLKEQKGKATEREWKRTCTSPDDTTEGMQPMRCGLNSPDTSTSVEEILPVEKKWTLESKLKEKKGRTIDSSKAKKTMGNFLERNWSWSCSPQQAYPEETFPFPTVVEGKLKEKKSKTIENCTWNEKKSRPLESGLNRGYNPPPANTEETFPHPKSWRPTFCNATSSGKGTLDSKSKDKEKIGMTAKGKLIEKNGRTSETDSKRRHSAPNASLADVLPVKWRIPKDKWLVESKWKEKNGGTNEIGSKFKGKASGTHEFYTKVKEKTSGTHEIGSKLKVKASWTVESGLNHSHVIRDATSSRTIPRVKRKYSYSEDASTEEEIPLPQRRKKTPDIKFKDKESKIFNRKLKEQKIKSTGSEWRRMSNASNYEDEKPARKARIPIRKLKSGYTSEDGTSDWERDPYGTSYPTFATEMKHSNVITCFWMGIPADFSNRHMPCYDQFMVLQDAKGLKWEANYLARKRGLSGGWRRFSLDHHLEMGDVVVFELVRPQKFLVHITKVFGVENTGATVHCPVKVTPKTGEKLKLGASTVTRRGSSKESARFSNRKRVYKDAEEKRPASRKPHLASDHKQQQRGEDWTSPNRLYHPGGSLKKDRQSARMETDCYEDSDVLSSFAEETESDEEGLETPRGRAAFSEFKHFTSTEDDRSDSNGRKDPRDLGLTVGEKSQKIESPYPKPGPPKRKPRRVSYFYSTDEDQGNSI